MLSARRFGARLRQAVISASRTATFLAARNQTFVAPPRPQPPSVYVINFMKANPAKVQEYLKLEQETWKPVHQERIRAGQMRSWALYNVQYPYGTSLEYDFVTIDTYASLADAERDISAIFAKVHPSAPLRT